MKTKKFIQILASNLTLAMKLSLDISTLYVSWKCIKRYEKGKICGISWIQYNFCLNMIILCYLMKTECNKIASFW